LSKMSIRIVNDKVPFETANRKAENAIMERQS
jgi:hypothetical protein